MTNLEAEKGVKVEKKKTKEERQPTKVVVRHLPPSMTLESFLEQVDVPPHDYICFGPADKTLMPSCSSRVYINFLNVEDLLIFTQKFDGYVFLDNRGHEYQAVVEFAPFQRIAKTKSNSTKKRNPKCGTIDSDPYFMEFKTNLQEEREKAASRTFKQHYFETNTENDEKKKITDTPLLQYLRNKNVEKAKSRDEKREERKRKEAERKKAREEQQNMKRTQAKKAEQDAQSNIVFTGGPYGNKRDACSRRKQDDRGKAARDKDGSVAAKSTETAKSKVSQKSYGGCTIHDLRDEKKLQDTAAPFQDPAIIVMRVSKANSRLNRQESNQQDRKQKQKEEKKTSGDGKFNKNKERFSNRENKIQERGERNFKNKVLDNDIKTEDIKSSDVSSNKANDFKGESSNKCDKTVSNEKNDYKHNYYSENVDRYRNRKPEKVRSFKDSKQTPIRKDRSEPVLEKVNKVDRSDKTTDKSRGSWKQNKDAKDKVDKTNSDRSPKKIDKLRANVENVDPKVSPRKDKPSTESLEANVLQRRKSFEGKQPEKFVESGRRNSLDSGSKNEDGDSGKEAKAERRIRNKDRPSIAIYRPGMGRFSKQRIPAEHSPSNSPSPTNVSKGGS